MRSPDAAWINLERWNALSEEQQEKFVFICPDFVVELNLLPTIQKFCKTRWRNISKMGIYWDG